MNSHSKFAHTIRSSRGSSSFGSSANESGSKRVPHHGQFSSGIGEGFPFGSALNCCTLVRAESERPSPLRPRMLGVAALPTQSPISNGQAPKRCGSRSRSSSKAQTRPAARAS